MANKKEHKVFITQRLIKSEDLNHHGSLYAGRSAEWFIESGFISATDYVRPEHLVCLKVHGIHFYRPARIGDVICFESKVVFAESDFFLNNNNKDTVKISSKENRSVRLAEK